MECKYGERRSERTLQVEVTIGCIAASKNLLNCHQVEQSVYAKANICVEAYIYVHRNTYCIYIYRQYTCKGIHIYLQESV